MRPTADEPWRAKARELLPELAEVIEEWGESMGLWVGLFTPFERAYEKAPPDFDLIERIYAYADWCLFEEQEDGIDVGHHLATAVCIGFWENIPTAPLPRADMPYWFWCEEVVRNRHFFSYHLEPHEFDALLALYDAGPPPGSELRGRPWLGRKHKAPRQKDKRPPTR